MKPSNVNICIPHDVVRKMYTYSLCESIDRFDVEMCEWLINSEYVDMADDKIWNHLKKKLVHTKADKLQKTYELIISKTPFIPQDIIYFICNFRWHAELKLNLLEPLLQYKDNFESTVNPIELLVKALTTYPRSTNFSRLCKVYPQYIDKLLVNVLKKCGNSDMDKFFNVFNVLDFIGVCKKNCAIIRYPVMCTNLLSIINSEIISIPKYDESSSENSDEDAPCEVVDSDEDYDVEETDAQRLPHHYKTVFLCGCESKLFPFNKDVETYIMSYYKKIFAQDITELIDMLNKRRDELLAPSKKIMKMKIPKKARK